MNGPDAIHARFADAVVPSAKLPDLREALTQGSRRHRRRPKSKP